MNDPEMWVADIETGFWDYQGTDSGWQVNVIDMGDPALSFGIAEKRYSWTVRDWQGREMASGQCDEVWDAKAEAEAAYRLTHEMTARRRTRTAKRLYHRTTPEAAEAIYSSGRMVSKEHDGSVFFSTEQDGQGEGYGDAVVALDVPDDVLDEIGWMDDEFPDGEEHWALDSRQLDPSWFVRTAARTASIPPPPEDNVSAYGYWEWCQQRGKSPADLENAAEYCSGWGEASDAKGIYEWIKPHLGATRTASTDLVARGIGYVKIPTRELCRKFVDGTVTAQEIVDMVLQDNNGRAGVWWGSIGDNEWDYYDYEDAVFHHAYYSSNAYPELILEECEEADAAGGYGDEYYRNNPADVGVVLWAEHPYVNGTFWNPLTDNKPLPGHESQSYVPEGTQLRLVKVGWVDAVNDETVLPANGMTVTAALGGQGITVTAKGDPIHTAGWEDDPLARMLDDDYEAIVDLLGGPMTTYEPYTPPERPKFDPIPGVEPGWEEYALDLLDREDRTHTADLWLPTDVVWYYREYDRSGNTGQSSAVEYALRQNGLRVPVLISTDGHDALLIEGNHRVMLARKLGIQSIPVRIQWDPNGVRANEGTPVPLEPVLEGWLRQQGKIARIAASPRTLYRGIRVTYDRTPFADQLREIAATGQGQLGEEVVDYLASASPHASIDGVSLGRHWTTDYAVARGIASVMAKEGEKGGIVLTAQWDGQGEDEGRSYVGGDYPEESEVTLLPGSQVTIVKVELVTDFGTPPITVWSGSSLRTAAEPGGKLPYQPSDFGYQWYEEPSGEYAGETRDGKSTMFLDIQGTWVNWSVYDEEGLVERGNFNVSVTDLDSILYRADRLLAEFDENPALPAKSWGYDKDYSETFPSSFPRPDFMQP